ncbi:MAG: T9SS type A sorting domain-containing protein [Bacteroidales bacterium]|nr:T9SS type A sorting domain-containing protein [Bacteroidales bacterium]
MKKSLLLTTFVILSQLLIAQDWAPINVTEKFCYEADTVGKISHVLFVNAMEETENGTIAHMNKTCVPYEDGYGSLYLFNQQQFLLDTYLINDDEWIFQDTLQLPIDEYLTFKIIPKAEVNQSWDFTDNITATVTSKVEIEVLGETDSVKVIQLSNEDSFTLTKNHGILDWNGDFELIGIEGRDLGQLVPNFGGMFAKITAGDVVCFHNGEWLADEQVTGWDEHCRYDIEEVSRYEDSIVINAYVRSNIEYNWKGKQPKITKGMQELVFYRDHISEVFPNDTLLVSSYATEGIVISTLGTHKWSGQKKTQLTFIDEWDMPYSMFHHNEGLYSNELYSVEEYILYEQSVDYGFIEYSNSGFEWGGYKTLVGIVDNGVTTGTIYPIDMFVGMEDIESPISFNVYPSPAKEVIYLSTKEKGGLNWQIFDVSGKQMKFGKSQSNDGETKINIGNLPKGVYILQLEINDLVARRKFIKY